MDKIDLKTLFDKEKFEILILTNTNQVPSDDDGMKSLVKDIVDNEYFLFIQNQKLVTFDSQTQLIEYNNNKVNFYRINRLIRETQISWESQYPEINFPKIHISTDGVNSVYFNNKNMSVIHITPDVFFNLHKLRFTLGHELGHLACKRKYVDHEYKFSHFNHVVLLLVVNLISSVYCSIEFSQSKNIFLLLISILNLGIFYFLTHHYRKVVSSFNSRMIKYNTELWCDFFSLKFMKINFYKRKSLFKIGDDALGETHPRSNDRFYYIRKQRKLSLENWKPISQEKSKYFRFYSL